MKKKMLTARIPKEMIRELDKIAKYNNIDRTEQIKKYFDEGIKKSKKALGMKFASFSIMVLTITAVSLWLWSLFV